LTTFPIRLFLALSVVGRLPTTVAFILQGAAFFDKDYTSLIATAAVCVLFAAAAYAGRGPLNRWFAKLYDKGAGRLRIPAVRTDRPE